MSTVIKREREGERERGAGWCRGVLILKAKIWERVGTGQLLRTKKCKGGSARIGFHWSTIFFQCSPTASCLNRGSGSCYCPSGRVWGLLIGVDTRSPYCVHLQPHPSFSPFFNSCAFPINSSTMNPNPPKLFKLNRGSFAHSCRSPPIIDRESCVRVLPTTYYYQQLFVII